MPKMKTRIQIPVTKEQYKIILNKAQSCGYQNLSEFCRVVLLNAKLLFESEIKSE